ncbi:AAA family ATPase [Dermatophilus congolensis]|uniref:Flp pilus assembly protein, ATPase CpaE n=1 Tax=Dermatophilus congolensis TaxID=1863 RepID=A0A239VIX2_9MICO|nr:hypothetical protein [Dermatophilus congolensis]MBO3129071.1 hypothetical protein [Dermatophilus congolensis]MBO3132293.1 hypothetical protein [Dermatophilus congolensis]MBO3133547.1 hypothetical protein [Dermatophilus congolensis]MBO3135780.1 hypothetical protein [Dermatophilus congolensis]MBO3138020.1 hypothetical protein [Dermatophilus congolensis]
MRAARVRVIVGGNIGLLREALAISRGVDVVAEEEEIAGVAAAAEAALADVAIVNLTTVKLQRSLVEKMRQRGVAVLAAVPPGAVDEAQAALRLGGDGHVFMNAGPADVPPLLRQACERVTCDEQARTQRLRGRGPRGRELQAAKTGELGAAVEGQLGSVIALWGPAGAPGRTTIAVGVAAALAGRGVRTLLIDADTYGGAVAGSLGLEQESPGLVAALRLADRGLLEPVDVELLSVQAGSRLQVLTGLDRVDRWPALVPELIGPVFDVARRYAQVTVVDCGFALEDDPELSYDTYAPRRNGATLAALEAADHVVAVGCDDPVGLSRLEDGLLELAAVGSPAERVVVNQVRTPLPKITRSGVQEGESGPVMARSAAWRRLYLGHTVHLVPADPEGVWAARMRGVPVTALQERSPAGAGIDHLAQGLLEQVAQYSSV